MLLGAFIQAWTKCGSGERRSREMTRKIEEIITLLQLRFMKKREEKKKKKRRKEKRERKKGTKWEKEEDEERRYRARNCL